jgi:tetratricopeptide (TPR) repeat protein
VARFREAIADYDEALRLRPAYDLGYFNRATAFVRLREYDAAIADYDAALRIAPKSAISLFGRGVAKRARGDIVAGDADIAAAEAINGNIASEMAELAIRP